MAPVVMAVGVNVNAVAVPAVSLGSPSEPVARGVGRERLPDSGAGG